jgi:carbonic anhydrase
MSKTDLRWLDTMLVENAAFRGRVQPEKLPVQRTPGSVAVITCMDPRVNLEAIGIPGFTHQGEGPSSVRVIRTIGAMAEPRSLVIGIFLAGIREIALVMHTDCGCCLAFSQIDRIIDNMQKHLTLSQWQEFKHTVGEPFRENLRAWLKAFEDPRVALTREIAMLKALPFMPQNVIVHGLLYELVSGNIEVVLNGYEEVAS